MRNFFRTLSGPLPLVTEGWMARVACSTCGHATLVRDGALAIHGPPSRPDLVCPGSGASAMDTEPVSAGAGPSSSGDPGTGGACLS